MCDIPYQNIPVTTLTAVADLYGEINIGVLFCLIPITYLHVQQDHKDIPKCNVFGAVISALYEKQCRGVPKHSRCFKNSVMLELSLGNKNLSLIVSHSKIQLVGATSVEMADMAVKTVLIYIRYIQENLDRMHQDEKRTSRTLNWVLQHTRKSQEIQGERYDLVFPPEKYHARKPYPFPDEVDEKLARWFIPMMSDFSFHSDYQRFLEFIQSIQYVQVIPWSKPPTISIHMMNRNFSIPFMIHRRRLYQLFLQQPDWIAIFDATFSPSVRIRRISRKKKIKTTAAGDRELPCYHSFIVFSTGSVTQSGSDVQEAEEFFNDFNRIIREHKDLVRLKTKVKTAEKHRVQVATTAFENPYCLEDLTDLL